MDIRQGWGRKPRQVFLVFPSLDLAVKLQSRVPIEARLAKREERSKHNTWSRKSDYPLVMQHFTKQRQFVGLAKATGLNDIDPKIPKRL